MDIEQAGLILTLNKATNLYIVGTSRPSAETNRSRFGIGLGLTLTPDMATSRSTSGPEPKLPVSRYLYMDVE